MALEADQAAWDLFLIVFQGIVLAVVLNKWQAFSERRREQRLITELMKTFVLLLKDKKAVELYYFFKLQPAENQYKIQSVLLMEKSMEAQSDSMGKREVLQLENNQFRLRLDPKWESHLYAKGQPFYSLTKPTDNQEIYTAFMEYVVAQCAGQRVPV